MPILTADTLEFISRNPEQTRRLGARLGHLLRGGDVIALVGELGSGKTVFAQGIGEGWGTTTPLISPTFILVRQHERYNDPTRLYHVDLYRLEGAEAIATIGLEELLGDPAAVTIVEWADRAPDLFPEERLRVELRWMDTYRRALTFRAFGARHRALLDDFRARLIGQ